MGITWTPIDGVHGTPYWPSGDGKAMIQYSAGGYNASNPSAVGCSGHNQIISGLDYYWNMWLSAFGYGSSSGVAQAISGQKQSPGALVAGIKSYYTKLGKSQPGYDNYAAGTRAPIQLIAQMRGAIDNAEAPNLGLASVYGGWYGHTWTYVGGVWTAQPDTSSASGGQVYLHNTVGHVAVIYRLWMQITGLGALAGWSGPLWYRIQGVTAPGPGSYTTDWWVTDGAQANQFAIYGSAVNVASAVNLHLGFSPNVYIPLGIYPTIGSSGTITVQALFTNDVSLVPSSVNNYEVMQSISGAEPVYFL